jgi:hypothetical protein
MPLAGTPAAAKAKGGLSMGLLGGIAAALVAVIGVGGLMLRNNLPDPPPIPSPTPQPVPTPPRPPGIAIPPQPPPQTPFAPIQPPVTVNPPGLPTPPPGQPGVVPPTSPAPDPGGTVGRLTILTPPAGSSCQTQVLEMNPRFVETVVELGASQPVLEIDSQSICGLAIAGSGPAQARFAQGTVTGTVPSLSSTGRIVFNPSNTTGRLPDIAVSGGGLEKIELRRK